MTKNAIKAAYEQGWNDCLSEPRPFYAARISMCERYLAALSVPPAAVVGEPVGDIAYNAGLEIRYAIAASGVDPIQHIPEVDAIIERRLAEARKAAFIEAAEIAEKLFTAEFTPQEPGFMRGIGYAAQTIFDDLRAKAEETKP